MKKILLQIASLILLCCTWQANATTLTLVATAGDSFTQQTGNCQRLLSNGATVTYNTGDCLWGTTDAYQVIHPADKAYGTYLNYSDRVNGYALGLNVGEGGATCDGYSNTFPDPKSLLQNLNNKVINPALAKGIKIVSVLIGGNDYLGHYLVTSLPAINSCLTQVWAQLQSSGFDVVAMTYPKVNNVDWYCSNHEHDAPNGDCNSNTLILELNASIRSLVTTYNSTSSKKVALVDLQNIHDATDYSLSLFTIGPNSTPPSSDSHPNSRAAKRMAAQWIKTNKVFQ
ncbi:MAG: SGNH/GDSL hydrolase family protein [Methylovulum sp.]|nr:SGNH/GDSL hydrolase family protein [Methylovulum sp.]